MDLENMHQDDLMRKIHELTFATVELNLYLDNHPHCEKALVDYNTFTCELMKMKKLYEQKFGPLSNFGCSESKYPWAWVNEPWPWEIGE